MLRIPKQSAIRRRPDMLAQAPATLQRILITDLVLYGRLGVYEHEKETAQRVRLNLDLEVAAAPDLQDGDLAAVVDYAKLIGRLKALVTSRHFGLAEVLVERLAELCLEDARVRRARVRVEKLDVIPEAAAVGVEVERQNSRPVPAVGDVA